MSGLGEAAGPGIPSGERLRVGGEAGVGPSIAG